MNRQLQRIKRTVIERIRFERPRACDNDLEVALNMTDGFTEAEWWQRYANSAYDKIRFELMPIAAKARVMAFRQARLKAQ